MAKNYASASSNAVQSNVETMNVPTIVESVVSVDETPVDVTQEFPAVESTEVESRTIKKGSKLSGLINKNQSVKSITEPVIQPMTPEPITDIVNSSTNLTGTAKLGWILIGMSSGLIGILGCFLITRKTPKMKKSIIWCAVGMVIVIVLSALFLASCASMLASSMGMLNGFENPDYYSIPDSAYSLSSSSSNII